MQAQEREMTVEKSELYEGFLPRTRRPIFHDVAIPKPNGCIEPRQMLFDKVKELILSGTKGKQYALEKDKLIWHIVIIQDILDGFIQIPALSKLCHQAHQYLIDIHTNGIASDINRTIKPLVPDSSSTLSSYLTTIRKPRIKPHAATAETTATTKPMKPFVEMPMIDIKTVKIAWWLMETLQIHPENTSKPQARTKTKQQYSNLRDEINSGQYFSRLDTILQEKITKNDEKALQQIQELFWIFSMAMNGIIHTISSQSHELSTIFVGQWNRLLSSIQKQTSSYLNLRKKTHDAIQRTNQEIEALEERLKQLNADWVKLKKEELDQALETSNLRHKISKIEKEYQWFHVFEQYTTFLLSHLDAHSDQQIWVELSPHDPHYPKDGPQNTKYYQKYPPGSRLLALDSISKFCVRLVDLLYLCRSSIIVEEIKDKLEEEEEKEKSRGEALKDTQRPEIEQFLLEQQRQASQQRRSSSSPTVVMNKMMHNLAAQMLHDPEMFQELQLFSQVNRLNRSFMELFFRFDQFSESKNTTSDMSCQCSSSIIQKTMRRERNSNLSIASRQRSNQAHLLNQKVDKLLKLKMKFKASAQAGMVVNSKIPSALREKSCLRRLDEIIEAISSNYYPSSFDSSNFTHQHLTYLPRHLQSSFNLLKKDFRSALVPIESLRSSISEYYTHMGEYVASWRETISSTTFCLVCPTVGNYDIFVEGMYHYFLVHAPNFVDAQKQFATLCLSLQHIVTSVASIDSDDHKGMMIDPWIECFASFLGIGFGLPFLAFEKFILAKEHVQHYLWQDHQPLSTMDDDNCDGGDDDAVEKEWILFDAAKRVIRLVFHNLDYRLIQMITRGCEKLCHPAPYHQTTRRDSTGHPQPLALILPLESFLSYLMDVWRDEKEDHLLKLEAILKSGFVHADGTISFEEFVGALGCSTSMISASPVWIKLYTQACLKAERTSLTANQDDSQDHHILINENGLLHHKYLAKECNDVLDFCLVYHYHESWKRQNAEQMKFLSSNCPFSYVQDPMKAQIQVVLYYHDAVQDDSDRSHSPAIVKKVKEQYHYFMDHQKPAFEAQMAPLKQELEHEPSSTTLVSQRESSFDVSDNPSSILDAFPKIRMMAHNYSLREQRFEYLWNENQLYSAFYAYRLLTTSMNQINQVMDTYLQQKVSFLNAVHSRQASAAMQSMSSNASPQKQRGLTKSKKLKPSQEFKSIGL